MSFDQHNVPFASGSFFSTNFEFHGRGRAEFLDPAGAVEGPTHIRFDEFGESIIEMTIENVESEQPLQMGLMELFSGYKPVRTAEGLSLGIGGGENTCTKLIVSSREGELTATEGLHFGYSLQIGGGDEPARITFNPLRSRYDVKGAAAVKYWVMPLTNFLSKFVTHYPPLDSHPLRILRQAEVIERQAEEAVAVQSKTKISDRLILFQFNDRIGFIEPLPDYESRRDNLMEGRERRSITAVMVGEVGSKSIDYEDLDKWFPFDFLRLLGFTTGTRVGAPWIEFRDAQGELVRRFYSSWEQSPFSRGHRIIEEGIHSGQGYLLSRYQSSPDRGKPFLSVALKHIIQGGSYSQSIEDDTVYLCRALDGLCDHYGFKTQYLLQELDKARQESVRDSLQKAAQEIRVAAHDAVKEGLLDQSRILEKIAERVRSNAANKDVDFGLAVASLLKHFNLPDADIVDAHYRVNPRPDGIQTWSGVLSHYRGTTMHRGFFDISGKRHDFDDIIIINDHLLDILIRLIFKIISYDGKYQPPVIKMTANPPADWVTPDLPAARLGYK